MQRVITSDVENLEEKRINMSSVAVNNVLRLFSGSGENYRMVLLDVRM